MAKTILQRWHDSFTGGADVDGANSDVSGDTNKDLRLVNSFNTNTQPKNVNNQSLNSSNPIPVGRSYSILASLIGAYGLVGGGFRSPVNINDTGDLALTNLSSFGNTETSPDRAMGNAEKAHDIFEKIQLNNTLINSPPNVRKKAASGGPGDVEETETGIGFEPNVVRGNMRIGPQEDAITNWQSLTTAAGVDTVDGSSANKVIDFNSSGF
tara:strand:+ start:30 stop:662 length:633 start_codon:yes stop_codon:yes gene_type:complete